MPSFIAGFAMCVLLIALSIFLLEVSDEPNTKAYNLPGVHVTDTRS